MNTLEDRVRAALRAHAEDFSADPDAWTRIRARSRAAGTRRGRPRWSRLSRFLIPASAAAAVVVIVVAAMALSNVFGPAGSTVKVGDAARPKPTSTANPGAVPSPAGPYSSRGPASELLKVDPPVSAVIGLQVPPNAPITAAHVNHAWGYFWIGYAGPGTWFDQITPGPQFCNDTVDVTNGESSGFCWPLPQLSAAHLASVTGNENVGTGQTILVGAAAAQVTYMAAILPDGQLVPGVLKTGRGFPDKAWTVGYPPTKGVHLVFRDSSGHEITDLSPAAPNGPRQIAQPRSGGVPVFRFNGGEYILSGTMLGYLIDGRVGFWSRIWGGEISPVPANGAPVLGGLLDPFDQSNGGWQTVEAFGYAHADVARVVLHLPDGNAVTTSTFAAGWAGSDLRLWDVALPSGTWVKGNGLPTITATGEDAAGRVLGQVQLGGME
jgi:hypothetical protein